MLTFQIMNKPILLHNRKQILEQAKRDIREAIEIIKISRDFFQKQLSVIRQEVINEKNEDKRQKLMLRAENLYKAYKESLQIIEEYMDMTYQKIYQ